MLEQIYKSQSTIQQLRDGILGDYIDDFSTHLIKKGYSQQTLHSYFGCINKLSSWLQDHQLKLNEFNERRINEFIESRKKSSANFVRKGDGRALQLLVEFLRNEKIIPKHEICPPENKSVEALIQEFDRYLTEEKGLADSTVNREKDVVRQFLLKQFGQQTHSVSRILLKAHC
jgi:site-specific recombinase XerD